MTSFGTSRRPSVPQRINPNRELVAFGHPSPATIWQHPFCIFALEAFPKHGREVVTYLRVSTQLQGLDGFGIAAQRDAVVRFSHAFGGTIVAEYAEVETGRKDHLRNRPQLVCAVAHASRSKALLVIARLDRLARSVLVTSQLLESGVEFVACDNPHANRLTIQILAEMAEHEGRLISERIKAGLAAARARGVVFGSKNLTPEARRLGRIAGALARATRNESRISRSSAYALHSCP